jgi:uncharacterized protein (TIGR02231 family)
VGHHLGQSDPSATAHTPAEQPPAETQISAVVLYPKAALVTRRGQVRLSGTATQLSITGLPATLRPQSIRAQILSQGPAVPRLAGVQAQAVMLQPNRAEQIQHQTQQIHQLEDQYRQVKDSIAASQLQRQFIEGLAQRAVGSFARGLAQQSIPLEAPADLMAFLGQQYETIAAAIAQKERHKHELDQQLHTARQQLQDLQNSPVAQTYTLLLALDGPAIASATPTDPASQAIDLDLEISYEVAQAGWAAHYDLRLSPPAGQLTLQYCAAIWQRTGEDWSAVTLCLATAKPDLGNSPPRPLPWSLTVKGKRVGQGPSAKAGKSTLLDDTYRMLGALPGSDIPLALKEARGNDAGSPAVEPQPHRTLITFDLPGHYHLASGAEPEILGITSQTLPCELTYLALPQTNGAAYLQATLTNSPTGPTLLPGPVNLFRHNGFVGTTNLGAVVPGETLVLSLGTEDAIDIQRNLVEKTVTTQGSRCTTLAYRLTVNNTLDHPIDLTLIEQLPISQDAQIKVTLLQVEPAASQVDLGKCEWQLTLQPQTPQTVFYQVQVEHPLDLTVSGLEERG